MNLPHPNGAKMRHAIDWFIRIGLALLMAAYASLWTENRAQGIRINALEIEAAQGTRFTGEDAAQMERDMRDWLETVRDNEIERAAETHAEIRRRIEVLERR